MTKMDSGVRRARSENPDAARMSLLPSELVRRQVFITFQEDPAGIAGTAALGLLDNCLWASDYPHGGSTWPNSVEVIRDQTAGLGDEITSKLIWENASKLYGLE
jgi:predicted TIM-barrel fold metal-dependent hydrolase